MEKKNDLGKFIGPAFLIAVFIASAVLVVKNAIFYWSVIITWPNLVWSFATQYSPEITFAAFVFFYAGIFMRTINEPLLNRDRDWWYKIGRPISDVAYYFRFHKSKNKQKIESRAKFGRSLIWIFGIWAIINIFPFANYSGMLKILSIIIGGIVLVSLEIFFLNKFKELLKLDNFFRPATMIFILIFTYYLDFFIFGWNKPKISALIIILAAITVIIIKAVNAIKRVQNLAYIKAGLEKMATEKHLAELEAKAHFEELQQSGLYELFVNYVKSKKNGQHEEAALIIKAYIDLRLEGEVLMNEQEKLSVLRKIHAINFNVDKELFVLIAMEYSDDCKTMLFTHSNEPINRGYDNLPILFKYSDEKKKIIIDFINKPFESIVFFNKVKKEFHFRNFLGVVNALTYAYSKEWEDEDHLSKIVAALNVLLAFGAGCLPQLWDKHESNELSKYLNKLQKDYEKNGVQVCFPEIPEIPEGDDESPVV